MWPFWPNFDLERSLPARPDHGKIFFIATRKHSNPKLITIKQRSSLFFFYSEFVVLKLYEFALILIRDLGMNYIGLIVRPTAGYFRPYVRPTAFFGEMG
jgi:hypothetical protein